MKKLLYSALIGSLALAFSAQAAKENKDQKKDRGAKNVQKAHGKAGGQGQGNVNRNSNQMHAQKKAMHAQQKAIKRGGNPAAVVHQNNPQGNVNAAAMQRNAVRNQRRNAQIAHAQNQFVNPQQNVVVNPQNVAVNRQGNVINRHRNVAIVNNWSGSNYSAPQYSAFRNYRRERHDRNWYQSRYSRIVLFGGGNYYWNDGYWYPAWGYNSGYNYGYDGPIYGYNDLDPQQVVVNVQRQLQEVGYYGGPIDGSIGPITRRALAAFQADQGLAITSAVDRPTLERLGLV